VPDCLAPEREALIKEPPENALVFSLARPLFFKQEWPLPFSTVSKKVKQGRQTEYISVFLEQSNFENMHSQSLRHTHFGV